MPIKDMTRDECFHEMKKKHPKGTNSKMNKKEANKQRAAICLSQPKESLENKMSIKSLIEGMTFKGFLIAEASAQPGRTYSLGTVIKANPLFKEFFGSFTSDVVKDEKSGRRKRITMTDSTVVDKIVNDLRAEIEQHYPEIDFDRLTAEDIQTLTPEIEAFMDMKNDEINKMGASIYKDDPTTAYDDERRKEEDDYLDSMDELNRTMFGSGKSRRKQRDTIDMKLKNDTEMKAARDEVAAMRANPDDAQFVRLNQAKSKASNMKQKGATPGKQAASGVLYRIKKTGWFQQMDPSQQEQVVANVRSGMSGAEAKAAAMGG